MGIVVIQGTDAIKDSRAVLNDNFAYLNSQIQAPVVSGYTTAFSVTEEPFLVTVPGLTHQLGTASLSVTAWDTTGSLNTPVVPDTVAIDRVTFDVTVTFGAAQTGILVIK